MSILDQRMNEISRIPAVPQAIPLLMKMAGNPNSPDALPALLKLNEIKAMQQSVQTQQAMQGAQATPTVKDQTLQSVNQMAMQNQRAQQGIQQLAQQAAQPQQQPVTMARGGIAEVRRFAKGSDEDNRTDDEAKNPLNIFDAIGRWQASGKPLIQYLTGKDIIHNTPVEKPYPEETSRGSLAAEKYDPNAPVTINMPQISNEQLARVVANITKTDGKAAADKFLTAYRAKYAADSAAPAPTPTTGGITAGAAPALAPAKGGIADALPAEGEWNKKLKELYNAKFPEREKTDTTAMDKSREDLFAKYRQQMEAMQQRAAEGQTKFKGEEDTQKSTDFFRSLIAAAEASRGQRGFGAQLGSMLGGYGKAQGSYMDQARSRREAQDKLSEEQTRLREQMDLKLSELQTAKAEGDFNRADALAKELRQDKIKQMEIQSAIAREGYQQEESTKRQAMAGQTSRDVAGINANARIDTAAAKASGLGGDVKAMQEFDKVQLAVQKSLEKNPAYLTAKTPEAKAAIYKRELTAAIGLNPFLRPYASELLGVQSGAAPVNTAGFKVTRE